MTDKIKQCGNCEFWYKCHHANNKPARYGICEEESLPDSIVMNETEGTNCHVYKERNNGN